MSNVSAPLPTTLAECHAQLQQLAADNTSLRAVNGEQRVTIDQQQAAINEQQATIEQQQATIDEQQTVLQSLQRDLALMKRALFGQRRERFEDPRQGLLFDSAEVGLPGQDGQGGEDDGGDDSELTKAGDGPSPTRRRGRGRRVIPECLPLEKRVQELTDEEIPEELRGLPHRRFLKKVGEWVEWERLG